MGKRPRRRPSRLGEKLRKIRAHFGLSQTQMWRKLGIDDYLPYTVISGYERGLREPSLEIVLQYARLVSIPMETLVDDRLELPARLSAPVKATIGNSRKSKKQN